MVDKCLQAEFNPKSECSWQTFLFKPNFLSLVLLKIIVLNILLRIQWLKMINDSSTSRSASENVLVRCACEFTDEGYGDSLIQCQRCKRWQHAICFNLAFDSTTSSAAWSALVGHHCLPCCFDTVAGIRGLTDPSLSCLRPTVLRVNIIYIYAFYPHRALSFS